jgi:hypothetical protein
MWLQEWPSRFVNFIREVDDQEAAKNGKEDSHQPIDDEDPSPT